jgi:hypothetical protein
MCRDIGSDFFGEKERRASSRLRYWYGRQRGSRPFKAPSKQTAAEAEALREECRRHIAFGETSNVGSGYELGETIPISGWGAKKFLSYQAANYRRPDPQQGCRFPIVEEAFRRYFDAPSWSVPAQIFGQEEITSDPTRSCGVPDWCEVTANDSSDHCGQSRTTAQKVLHRVA